MAKTLKTPAATPKAQPAKIEEHTFEYDGKTYRITKGAHVPTTSGTVLMTAADIAVNADAQKYLVDHKCSCVEVVE